MFQQPRDPAQHLILRTLILPAALLFAILCLLPTLSHAAERPVFEDAPTASAITRVEVFSAPAEAGQTVTFRVKVQARAHVQRIRAEFATSAGWDTVELERSGNGFLGTATVADASELQFFLMGADETGRITDLRYGTLGAPARIETAAR